MNKQRREGPGGEPGYGQEMKMPAANMKMPKKMKKKKEKKPKGY